MSNNLIENEGVFFSKNTPELVQEVLLDCINSGAKVHILTGDPLSGLIAPKINSVGVVVKSSGKQPMPMLRVTEGVDENGELSVFETPRDCWLSTDRILKVSNATENELLYQSYECQCSPLKFVSEVEVSQFGGVTRKARIVCSNPECELVVPEDADAVEWCNFLFGRTHQVPMRK